MMKNRFFCFTNRRARIIVGLLLVGMFTVQCTRSHAIREQSPVMAISGEIVGSIGSEQQRKIEQLAKTDHIKLLRQALENCRNNYRDYTCVFVKQERIHGVLKPQQEMEVKFLDEPFSVSMRWIKNAPTAERILFVRGKYNNMMLVKPKGFLGNLLGVVRRAPNSPDVMANTLKPITDFGFENMIKNLLRTYELAASRHEGVSKFAGYARLDGRKVLVLKRVLPPREDYPAKSITWYLDLEYFVPVGIEATDWNNNLIYSYFYKNIRFNVGLTPEDFTPQANGMNLKKK